MGAPIATDMESDWRSLLAALREITSADSEADCVARISEQVQQLFGRDGLRLVVGSDRGPPGERFELSADGDLLGVIVLDEDSVVSFDVAERIMIFAEHAARALRSVRRLDECEHRSRRDALTGLRNYREFRETLSRLLSVEPDRTTAGPVSLVVIDLDRFKDVNDRYGHAAGDRLLRAAAAALSAVCRDDDNAFRIGGDEFALILPDATGDQARVIAERAHGAVTRLSGCFGASWGVAAAPADGTTHDELMAAADSAMYIRKSPESAAAVATGHTRRRLATVARLTTRLTEETEIAAIAAAAVEELHGGFGYYLAVVQRLDLDQMLRVVAGAGPLAASSSRFLAWEQSVHTGVNGRVAKTRTTAVVPDTRLDADYLAYHLREDPGSEVSVPIMVVGRLWGILNLEQIAAHGFDDSDVHLAEAVAAVTAAAIHRCEVVELLDRGSRASQASSRPAPLRSAPSTAI
jgi:diguanylate cyclase (GGDEF)-like protein